MIREITIYLKYISGGDDWVSFIFFEAHYKVIQKRIFKTNKIIESGRIEEGSNLEETVKKIKDYIKSSDIPYKVYIEKGFGMNELYRESDIIFKDMKEKLIKEWMSSKL